MKRIGLFWRALPLYILSAAMVALPYWQRHQTAVHAAIASSEAEARLVQPASKPIEPPHLQGRPVRILIPSLAIDLPVVDGQYNATAKIWSVASTKANYATNTALINNQAGSTLIYGHNNIKVFGKTKNIQTGDITYIYTDTGHIFQYMYEGDTAVNPTDTWIFSHLDGKPGLRLMTCQGKWNQERRIMAFRFINAS